MATDTAPAPTDAPPVRRQQWQLPAFAVGLTAAILALNYFPPQPSDPAAGFRRELGSLRKQIDTRPVDVTALESQMKRVAAQLDRRPEEANRGRFLLGSAHVLAAENGSPTAAADHWTQANGYFAKCDAMQLGDKADAGRCVFRSAKAAAAAGAGDPKLLLPALAALPPGEEPGEQKRLLADTCLRVNPPDLKRARDEYAAFLSSTQNKGTPGTVAKHKLKLAEICVSLNEPDKARTWLKEIGPTAPPDVQAVAKVQLARMAAAESRWPEAVKLFEEAQKTPGLPADQKGLIFYETGRGLQALNNPVEATKYYQQARTANGTAGVAATVRLAGLAAKTPAGPVKPAELLESVVKNVKSPGDFHNPHMGVEELRATFEEVIQAGMTAGDYESAVRTVAAYTVVAPPGRARQRQAEATAGWAVALAAASDPKSTEKFRAAADDFTASAVEATDPATKADLFRQAAECFTRAGDPAAAADVYDRMQKIPGVPPTQASPAQLAKADLLFAEGKFADAVEVLKGIVTAGGSDAGRAQLRLARAHMEESNRKLRAAPKDAAVRREADGLRELGRNLLAQLANKTPETAADRDVQQQALFDLGKYLLARDLPQAEARLRQLMQTNPTGRLGDGGRLYLGTALLMLARGDNNVGQPPTDAEKKLTEAVKLFEELSKSNEPFYRSHGDIRLVNATLQLRKYDELAKLSDTLATRYRDQPEELVVLSMLYTGHLQADRPQLAARVLARMTDAFGRIPDDAYRGGMEEFHKAYWTAWFETAKKR